MNIKKQMIFALLFFLPIQIISQEIEPKNFSTQSAQTLGEVTISAVTNYVTDETRSTEFSSFVKTLEIPDKAFELNMSYIVEAMETGNSFMAIQMLGQLLNSLNEIYGTTFKTNDIINDLEKQRLSPSAIPARFNEQPTTPGKKIPQSWMAMIWENIKYYIDRGYQLTQDIFSASKEQWDKSRQDTN
jgi:hypothetical protein